MIGGTLIPSNYDFNTLFGINPDNVEMGMQSAVIADKIMRGTPAGSIPVSSAEPRLTINYRAAKKLGVNVSEGLLAKADLIVR